jgi:hypothetical protein
VKEGQFIIHHFIFPYIKNALSAICTYIAGCLVPLRAPALAAVLRPENI